MKRIREACFTFGKKNHFDFFILISGGLYFMTRLSYFNEMYWRAKYLLRTANITEKEIAQLLLKSEYFTQALDIEINV